MEVGVRHILKRSVELGIAWWHKYRDDLFFRTTVHVIALQAALVIFSIAAFGWVLRSSNAQIDQAIVSHATVFSTSAQVLAAEIDHIQTESIRYIFAVMVALMVIFGLLLAYATLRPARESLHYQKLFISNIAHELRTPLSTIKTSTEVALLDESLSSDIRHTFRETIGELDRASEIINNLISLNRLLRPGKMEFTNVDLATVVERVIERVSGLALERNIEILTKNSDYTVVLGNAAALEQVVENIIKNAIHYTPKNRHAVIAVSIRPDYRGSIIFSVEDNGIGIAQRDLFHIFEPFYRADLSRTRNIKKGGSGLGLAIVNEITRLHKGKIHIQSSVGKGTTVSVVLPAGAMPVVEPRTNHTDPLLNELSVDFSKES